MKNGKLRPQEQKIIKLLSDGKWHGKRDLRYCGEYVDAISNLRKKGVQILSRRQCMKHTFEYRMDIYLVPIPENEDNTAFIVTLLICIWLLLCALIYLIFKL